MGFWKPAWFSENVEKAKKAAEKESDQVVLFEIAKSAPHFHVRCVAASKLTNVYELMDILKNDCAHFVRDAAVNRLRECVKNLTDQEALIMIAKSDQAENIRDHAINQLTNQTVLADIPVFRS